MGAAVAAVLPEAGEPLLLSGFSDDLQCIPAVPGNGVPVCLSDGACGEEFGAHSYAVGSGTEPGCQIFFCGFDASCYHQFAPRKGSKQSLDHSRAQDISGEDLAEVASGFLGIAYFGHAAAAGGVRNKAPVADSGHFGIEQGTDNEAGS